MSNQVVQGYHENSSSEIAQKITEALEKQGGKLKVSSIAMSEAWPAEGNGWINALVVFERVY